MRLRLSTKPTWAVLRAQVIDVLGDGFVVSSEDEPPTIAWRDGPAEGHVAQAIGEVAGWRFESAMLGPDPDAPTGRAVIRFERSFSVGALARAVIRFQASNVRPFDSAREGAVAKLWAILEEDDPGGSVYPLVESMTAMLLDGYDGAADADALSRRLRGLGYDALWSRAWLTANL